ncbi:MAG: ABC transporter ATP-binding protein [Cyanobacteriota bacterium ELA615]
MIRKNLRPKRENDWKLFLRLVPYLRRHKSSLVVSVVLLIPLAFASAVQPLIVGQAVSLLLHEPTWSFLQGKTVVAAINTLSLLLLLTIVIRLCFVAYQGTLVQKIGQQITTEVREDLFSHVTHLPLSFFEATPVGKLVTRITSDVEALGEVFSSGAIGVLSDLISMLVLLVVIFLTQWQLSLMLLLILVPVTFLIIYFQQEYRKANYQVREELSKLNSMLQENVSGINIVQMFERERYNSELFGATNEKYRLAVDRTILHDSSVSATLEWVAYIAIAGVLWLGGLYILHRQLDFGILSAFILFAQRLFTPLRQFGEKFTTFQSGFTAVERITELMQEPTINTNEDSNLVLDSSYSEHLGEIRFENVCFGYKPDQYILKDLNFTLKPGQKIAIVGPTGAGKTSLIRLLCRLYEPNEGRILVDGIDIKNIPKTQLRNYIGVILQESFLFAGNINRNITLGETYSQEQIQEAAKVTAVDSFISELPQGYQTQLRERGTNLSGGQKQLLAFARVAIRNPSILILDEATASLDVATEVTVQNALDKLLRGKTAIIIAHRLSTIRNVDKILVLKRGELVEMGTHEELLKRDGVYAGLYHLQLLGTAV